MNPCFKPDNNITAPDIEFFSGLLDFIMKNEISPQQLEEDYIDFEQGKESFL